jgi:hypothetical protein
VIGGFAIVTMVLSFFLKKIILAQFLKNYSESQKIIK